MADFPYAHLSTQAEQVRSMRAQMAERQSLLQAYDTFGRSDWGTQILNELVRTYVLGQPMPRLTEAPADVALLTAAYEREIWMREGERQLVQRLLHVVATAGEELAQLTKQQQELPYGER